MARSVRLLIPLLLCGTIGVAAAQEPEPAGPLRKRPWLRGEPGNRLDGKPSPEFDDVRKALEALTPEQRKRFQANFWRWANLPPDEKKALRDREELRRKFMREEVDAALRESGLQLDGPRRAEFMRRYAQERRKIEEQLREEMAEKRKPLVREVLARLKAEFTAPAAAPSLATPQP